MSIFMIKIHSFYILKYVYIINRAWQMLYEI